MTVIVRVVCFDLPADRAANVAKDAGGEVYEDGTAGTPVVIRVRVAGRAAPPAVRKAVKAVRAAMDANLDPAVGRATVPFVEDE